MRDRARPAIAALGFLTAVRVGRRTPISAGDLRRGVAFFPLVGALVGALMGVVAWAVAHVLPPVPAAILGVAAATAVTGALHLDALADTADGVGASLAGGDPAEAMSDPRLGTWGGAALVLDLLLKVSVLVAVLTTGTFPWPTVAAGALSRTSLVALAWAVPYGGPDEGTGAWTRGIDRRACLAGLGAGAAICLLAVGVRAVPMATVAALVCLPIAGWSRSHLDGMRGDTFGAAAECTETLALTASLLAL
ncbi:MAG TPA: adenosylcobinamide-GDP ribazoletransferase [Actinomycetota bacterium]|nr:adenosylcobinamide-GDP ribazoletransferase [Actinomycetota bacterium]